MVSYGMVVIVGITGARPGRMIMDTGRETARQISQLINGESYDIDDQFILYTMAELANIVSGKAISHINNMYRGLGLRLTPPGIFRGDLLQVSSPRINAEMISISTPLGDFSLSVGFEGGK
jgi:CheY-specific phosphatase CheX